MTTGQAFLWDTSHHDYPRGPMDVAAAKADGICAVTAKCAEGHHFFQDTMYRTTMDRARAAGMPLLGPYFVNHPGTVTDQVDWFIALVEQLTPWWRECPGWFWQIDAEQFAYMSRAPNLAEINAFGDLLCSRLQLPATRVVAYAPRWLYGDTLRGLRYELWASAYGTNPAVPYRQAYPGDQSVRWVPYSGQSPLLLQYGSQTTIGSQHTCDASAYRGTVAQLLAAITGSTSGGGTMAEPAPHEIVQLLAQGSNDGGFVQPGTPQVGAAHDYNLRVLSEHLTGQDEQLAAILAAIAAIPAGGGGGLTAEQVRAVVRAELDATRLTGQ
jgi:hypothetical protein